MAHPPLPPVPSAATSPTLMTPSTPPEPTPPPARVSERQYCSLEVGVVHPLLPSAAPAVPPMPHQVPGTLPSIDLENLDETLRLPFYQDLVPFIG